MFWFRKEFANVLNLCRSGLTEHHNLKVNKNCTTKYHNVFDRMNMKELLRLWYCIIFANEYWSHRKPEAHELVKSILRRASKFELWLPNFYCNFAFQLTICFRNLTIKLFFLCCNTRFMQLNIRMLKTWCKIENVNNFCQQRIVLFIFFQFIISSFTNCEQWARCVYAPNDTKMLQLFEKLRRQCVLNSQRCVPFSLCFACTYIELCTKALGCLCYVSFHRF